MIYVDLLVIENLILNYCLLVGTSVFLNRKTKLSKIFLSSVIGCIPLIFLFMNLSKTITFIISFIFSLFMSIIAFSYHDLIYTFKNIIYMYLISIFLAGSVYLINTSFFPKIDNFLLNFITLIIICPIITYVYIKSIIKINVSYSNYYLIDIYLKDKPKITLNSYLDTGNMLTDPYSGKPIILVAKDKINYQSQKIILVPYSTIDSQGLLKCFRPEKVYIDKIGIRKKLLIGIIEEIGIEGAECILNPKLLERI